MKTERSPLLIGPWWWRLVFRITHPCWCRKPDVVPHFDCPRHRTQTRGYCHKCKRYDLLYLNGETYCGWCGAGPLVEAEAEALHLPAAHDSSQEDPESPVR